MSARWQNTSFKLNCVEKLNTFLPKVGFVFFFSTIRNRVDVRLKIFRVSKEKKTSCGVCKILEADLNAKNGANWTVLIVFLSTTTASGQYRRVEIVTWPEALRNKTK